MRRMIGPFRVLEIRDLVLTNDENDITDTGSFDRTAPVGFIPNKGCSQAGNIDFRPQTCTKKGKLISLSAKF